VVAALQGTEVRKKPEMPFANQRGAVARLLQQRWQSRMAWRQADILRRRRIDRLFKPERKAILISSGCQGRPRRRAEGRVRVSLLEHQSFERQSVDVWRRVVSLAVAAHVRIAEVVRQDEDDVRFDSLRQTRTAKANPSQHQ